MWHKLAKQVIQHRIILLILLFVSTAVMGYFASKVKLSYEFTRAIPVDNPRYQDYERFKEKFGDDGNMMVIGIQSDHLFTLKNFAAYNQLFENIKKTEKVEDILSVPGAVRLQKDTASERLLAVKIFDSAMASQAQLDAAKAVFFNLPFYAGRLYNPQTNAYLMGVRIDKEVLKSKERSVVIAQITDRVQQFESETGIRAHLSGLPLIRTEVGNRIQAEMKIFLVSSLLLSILILLLFFRNIGTTILSLSVVLIGVIWAVALIHLCGYKITLLTALIPSLVVVIGIPNCIYFINKYHSAYVQSGDKYQALMDMVGKMGIVTLFCNIAAAIGFAVFAFTKSAILKEFGVVAGTSIMVIFFVSFILLPAVLSLKKAPEKNELKYLENKWVTRFLIQLEKWAFTHRRWVLGVTAVFVIFSLLGMMHLRTEGKIVDDLPKGDVIYQDLKFFEKNFDGVMPLEIVIDTKKKRGLSGMRALKIYGLVDSLSMYIEARPEMNKPLSVAEGLKFAKQGFFEGDSNSYSIPNAFDGAFVAPYLRPVKSGEGNNNFTKMLRSFMDSNAQMTRISVNMADVGTEKLPEILEDIEHRASELFDSTYQVTLTGTSISFLEGSKFIINGLKESVLWAFGLIAICMLFLFRSLRIVLCSLIPNVIPLMVTAGLMGWFGVALKPSTVLVFSVALGIAVDITIRFLVNYKQVLPAHQGSVDAAVQDTIQHTGLSIIYTSLVLIAGFVIFCASRFGGTFSLGWLTSVTLVVASLTNLVLLPVLLLIFAPNSKKREKNHL